MGNIFVIILLFIILSLGERLYIYLHGYTSSTFSGMKFLLILLFIGSILRGCSII